ncbi:class I SAM-dependent methyltransferase [Vagococcus hydrophili]|uniref:Methyltransferase domain-containing protein n=1 Tax=Vagococcus hydrophili TaxID=2714947 RepID=A0A6G8ASG2_9ENTE|nr:class I SAM-dependent methyltransferase [Vagococcus hydrophili]QIL47909.1 methyltransferase domain-containing protein [Vagococcus hydrophili]
MLKTSLRYSHELLEAVIEEGDIVVDATMGNGNDTLFLAERVGKKGHVYGFDVQEQALANTTKRLEENDCLEQATLLLQGHETVGSILLDKTIKAAVFNLGYLPKSDKHVVTHEATTITALIALLDRLEEKGRIILVIYDGHDEGKIEKKEVLSFVSELPQEKFSVLNYQFINQRNNPPSLICIERKKD